MNVYKHYSQDDVNIGSRFETRIKPVLEARFGALIQRSTIDRNDQFDFSNDKVFIDAKCRRNTKNQYPTTMVGENKVKMGLDLILQGKEVYFVFGFADVDCIWRLDRGEYEVNYGGRYDRGTPEIKSYAYVPIKYLHDIIKDAPQNDHVEESPSRISEATPE